ncbi:MAG: hypothetical protein HWN66_17930 [Candidatus Helarchaeota archaeon]|nr:hypothetical protein [Candidatus Helarchaeota archaeon]
MLTTKRRFLILFLVIAGGAIAFSTVILARVLNLGTNLQDPLYFDSATHSRFSYDNGTHVANLDCDSIPINSTRAFCRITFDGQLLGQFNVTDTGFYIDNVTGAITQNYTIFWIHIVTGGASEFKEHVGDNYSVIDPVGILGTPDTEYILTITEQHVYWAEEPPLHGAQFSLKFEVRDLTNTKVAEGEMDYTCGMLFTLYIGAGELRTLELIDTNYDISRNRLTGVWVSIIAAIVTPAVVFCYLHFRKKEPLEKTIETTFLVASGGAVLLIDIMNDVWFYATIPLGYRGNLFLHLLMVGIFAVYTLWRKVGLKWVIPAFLEVAFLFAMVSITDDAYVPHLTAFMGLTITWLCLLWAAGYERIPAKSKLGKLFSEFI